MERENRAIDEKIIIPAEFCDIYADMAAYENEFLDEVFTRKRESLTVALIKDFRGFARERKEPVEEEAHEFLGYFQNWKERQLKTVEDPFEKGFVRGTSPATLANFVRAKIEWLICERGYFPEGSGRFKEFQAMRDHWRRIGETIRVAHFIGKLKV